MDSVSQPAPVVTPVSVGVRYGIFTTLVWLIADVVLRVTGLSFKIFTVYLPVSILISVVGIVLAHRYYKSVNRYLSWKEGFIIGLLIIIISNIVGQLFNWLYVNFIDTDYPARLRADMQAWFDSIPNMPEEKKEEALADMSDEHMKSLGHSFQKAATFIIVMSVLLSAIVSLFTKRQPAEFE